MKKTRLGWPGLFLRWGETPSVSGERDTPLTAPSVREPYRKSALLFAEKCVTSLAKGRERAMFGAK